MASLSVIFVDLSNKITAEYLYMDIARILSRYYGKHTNY